MTGADGPAVVCTHRGEVHVCQLSQAQAGHPHPQRWPVCPHHFAALAITGLTVGAPGASPVLVAVLNHTIDHGWQNELLFTWSAMLHRYVTPPGVTPTGRPRVNLAGATPEAVARVTPWAPLFADLVAACIAGDGRAVYAALAAAGRLDNAARLDLFGSLVASTAQATNQHPEATSRALSLFALYGSQCSDVARFAVLPAMVDLTLHLGGESMATAEEATNRLAGTYSVEEALAALAVAARTLAATLPEPDTPGVLMVGEEVAGGGTMPTGFVRWDDPGLDDGLPRGARCAVRAMRIAMAYRDGDPRRALDTVRGTRDVSGWIMDATFGCMVLVGRAVASIDRRLNDPPTGQGGG